LFIITEYCHNQGLQVCRASLPGKSAGQLCRASLPGKSAGQVCRASLPGKSSGQVCRGMPGMSDQNSMETFFHFPISQPPMQN
jgi:hypothetical protein